MYVYIYIYIDYIYVCVCIDMYMYIYTYTIYVWIGLLMFMQARGVTGQDCSSFLLGWSGRLGVEGRGELLAFMFNRTLSWCYTSTISSLGLANMEKINKGSWRLMVLRHTTPCQRHTS